MEKENALAYCDTATIMAQFIAQALGCQGCHEWLKKLKL